MPLSKKRKIKKPKNKRPGAFSGSAAFTASRDKIKEIFFSGADLLPISQDLVSLGLVSQELFNQAEAVGLTHYHLKRKSFMSFGGSMFDDDMEL